jgi:hypothetical protein
MLAIIVLLLSYFSISLIYRNNQIDQIFILRVLSILKINKYRNKISDLIAKHEKRKKWFLFWPTIQIYEQYESWKKNRNRNIKS